MRGMDIGARSRVGRKACEGGEQNGSERVDTAPDVNSLAPQLFWRTKRQVPILLERRLSEQFWRDPKVHENAAFHRMDQHASRRQIPRHQCPPSEGIHAARGTAQDARGRGRLERRGG